MDFVGAIAMLVSGCIDTASINKVLSSIQHFIKHVKSRGASQVCDLVPKPIEGQACGFHNLLVRPAISSGNGGIGGGCRYP